MSKNLRVDTEVSRALFKQREMEVTHRPYSQELINFGHVKYGDGSPAEELARDFVNNKASRLSSDPLRCKKYLFVAAVAFTTRFAIEGGLNQELAYTLSDLYIQRADNCRGIEEIGELYAEMYKDFAGRVHELRINKAYSKMINEGVDYIYKHLHEKIRIEDICRSIDISPSYFSVLFKKETGVAVSDFIRKEKVLYAADLLKFSDFPYVDIGNYLAFSSHSHFITVFKKEMGLSPKEYRDKHYNAHWSQGPRA